jgi:hypothetical protein
MPFVQVFYTPHAGPLGAQQHAPTVTGGEVAEVLARELDCPPSAILVQTLAADAGSSPMALGIIRGRPRPRIETAVDALNAYLQRALSLDASAVMVRFEPSVAAGDAGTPTDGD